LAVGPRVIMASILDTRQPKRRWYQYSLRGLLLFVTLCAIACSWLAVTIQAQRKQHKAAEAIKGLGGTVQCEPTWLGKVLKDDSLVYVTEVDLSNQTHTDDKLMQLQALSRLRTLRLRGADISDAGLVRIEHLCQLVELDLSETAVTDAGLVHLRNLRRLKVVNLHGGQITDAGLVNLDELSQLNHLGLSNTKVTDAGLTHLQGLRKLQFLDVDGTAITDNGLVNVATLSELAWLALNDTNITDTGLGHLHKLTNLRSLLIMRTKITDAGKKGLQKALPKCKITQGHEDMGVNFRGPTLDPALIDQTNQRHSPP
jgi:Leucine-rich repeat (LRR) protein